MTNNKVNKIILVLDIEDVGYKMASIILSKNDSSIFLHTHCIVEKAPFSAYEPFHLLNTSRELMINQSQSRLMKKVDEVHISFHPNQIHYRSQNSAAQSEYLIEPYKPQPFKNSYRLLAIFTPFHPQCLPIMPDKVKKGSIAKMFKWNSNICPQFSIYELNKDIRNDVKSKIAHLGVSHIVFQHKNRKFLILCGYTNSEPNVWGSYTGIFGTPIAKRRMTKQDLVRSLFSYGLGDLYDLSALPDNAIINSVRLAEPLKSDQHHKK